MKTEQEMKEGFERKATRSSSSMLASQPGYVPYYVKIKEDSLKEGKSYFKETKNQVLKVFNADTPEAYEGLKKYLEGYQPLEIAAFFAVYGELILNSSLFAAETINPLKFLYNNIRKEILSFVLVGDEFYVLRTLLGENSGRERCNKVTPLTNALLLEKFKLLLEIDAKNIQLFMAKYKGEGFMTKSNLEIYDEALKYYREKQAPLQKVKS